MGDEVMGPGGYSCWERNRKEGGVGVGKVGKSDEKGAGLVKVGGACRMA